MENSIRLREELHFAKIDGSTNYAFIHSLFTGNWLHPGKSQYQSNLTYREFVSYLAGACFGKNKSTIFLYNGMPYINSIIFYHGLNLTSLDEAELDKLASDSKLE